MFTEASQIAHWLCYLGKMWTRNQNSATPGLPLSTEDLLWWFDRTWAEGMVQHSALEKDWLTLYWVPRRQAGIRVRLAPAEPQKRTTTIHRKWNTLKLSKGGEPSSTVWTPLLLGDGLTNDHFCIDWTPILILCSHLAFHYLWILTMVLWNIIYGKPHENILHLSRAKTPHSSFLIWFLTLDYVFPSWKSYLNTGWSSDSNLPWLQ